MARERRGLHADALGNAVFTEVSTPRPGGDRHVDRVAFGRHAEFFRADPDDRAQVAGFQLVFADHFALRSGQRFVVERHVHLEDLGRVQEALGVFLEAENRRAAVRRLVGAYAFENAHAVMQRVGKHVDLGVAPVDELAIHPDLAVAVGH
jgi:hypothetical protein